MAANEDRLLVRIEAQSRQFEQQMRRVNQTLDRTTAQNRRMLAQMQRDTEQASRRIWAPLGEGLRNQLAGLAGVMAATFSADQILRMADGFTTLENRLRVSGLEGEALAQVMDHLFAAASRNGVEVGALGELYGRLALSTGDLGISQEQLLGLMDGVTAALRVQGVSSQAASGALIQLSQALGSGTVRAEELNSLLEQTPVILQAAASGMGVSVSALSAQIREGEVSSREFFDALMTGFPAIQAQAENATLTIGQAMTSLSNELLRYIGMTDDSMGASERLATAIQALAENLNVVVTAAGIAVGVVGVRMAGAFVIGTASAINYQAALLTGTAATLGVSRASLLASASVSALGAAFRFLFTNPIGIAITAIATALALLAARGDGATESQRELEASVNRTEDALQKYRDAAEAARQASDENAAAARRNAEAMRAEAVSAIRSAIALRQRTAALRDEAVADAEAAAQRVRTAVGQAQTPLAQGEFARLSQIAEDARDAAREADEAVGDALKGLYNIDNPAAGGGSAPATSGGSTTGGGSRGPSAADLARQAEELANRRTLFDLEQALERARASSDERETARIQDQIDLIRLTAEYREAGYEDAEFQARSQIAAINQATDAVEARALAEERLQQRLQARAEAEREAADWARRTLDIEIEAARLAGDESRFRALEREAELRRRIAEYVERFGVVAGTGLAMAEQVRLDEAQRQGEMTDEARNVARGFVDILRSDDWAAEAGRRFQDAAWNNVEQLFAVIWRHVMGSMQTGGAGGGGWLSAGLNLIGNAVGGTKFGGAREGGGSVQSGMAYLVGEKRPEIFVPNTAGRIIPRIPEAAARSGQTTVHATYAPQIDARGADPAAIARLEALMETQRRQLPQLITATVNRGLARDRIAAPAYK